MSLIIILLRGQLSVPSDFLLSFLVAQCLHGQKKLQHKYVLLVDIKKAFDSVDKELLFSILRTRCRNDSQHRLVDLIESLYRDNLLIITDQEIKTTASVPQGGILSPLLFNIYLEEALLSQRVLADCMS